jgi:V8-like Glu-specific endopeptidase
MRIRLLAASVLALVAIPTGLALAASSATETLTTAMLGKNEVPKGAPTGSGTAVIKLDPVKGTVCWTFSKVKGITKVTAAHIHKAPKGKSGNVVVPFFAGALKTKGCVFAKATVIKAIEKSPTSYYVNIHTVKYPAGAIRGQL